MGLGNKLFYLFGGRHIMTLLTDVQSQVIALATAQIAEAARWDAKISTLNTTITGVNATLATVQAELDALKAGGQTPENQAIIDDISTKVISITTALNAEAI